MTRQDNYNLSSDVVEDLTQIGINAVPDLLRVLLNNTMQVERSKYLQVGEYERTEDRKWVANPPQSYFCLRQKTKIIPIYARFVG